MQFVFADSDSNYTVGYLQAYDDIPQGVVFTDIHQLGICKNLSQKQHQHFMQTHEQSIIGSVNKKFLFLCKTCRKLLIKLLSLYNKNLV